VKKAQILGALIVMLLTIPGYYRNRLAVDRAVVGMWVVVEGVWQHFAFESKKVGIVISGAVSGTGTGKSMPSQRSAEIEAQRESQKQIDEQEQKEVTGEDGGAAAMDKMRESDVPFAQRESNDTGSGKTGKPGLSKKSR
jgi:hypothetical protein